MNIKSIFTDLDGTLTTSPDFISSENYNTLLELGEQGITRVIATGRSYHSLRTFIEADLPIDYLIFSTGAGIMDWKTKKLIFHHGLNEIEIKNIYNILIDEQVDFMLQFPVPENHRFYYTQLDKNNSDFNARVDRYRDYCEELNDIEMNEASQFIVILPPAKLYEFDRIKKRLKHVQVIKTTSPLDHKSIWMEIFPPGISKGSAAHWLCGYLRISPEETLTAGNDYNDIELLDWGGISYVVGNAPEELKEKYEVAGTNCNNGFTEIIKKHFNLKKFISNKK